MTQDYRPNIIVIGVGHSGTTIISKVLEALGWNLPGADARYAEHTRIRDANTVALRQGGLQKHAKDIVRQLAQVQPWVVKDPRFTVTLALWEEVFARDAQPMPTLLWIKKDLAKVKKSYNRRGERVGKVAGNRWRGAKRGYTVDEQFKMVGDQFCNWSGPTISLEYDQLAAAAAMFKPR
jgi:hypothetical protein